MGIELSLSASAVTDIYYIASRIKKSKKIAMSLLKDLLLKVGVAAVTYNEIRKAVNLDWGDFEDAVQYMAGESIDVDCMRREKTAGFFPETNTLPKQQPLGC